MHKVASGEWETPWFSMHRGKMELFTVMNALDYYESAGRLAELVGSQQKGKIYALPLNLMILHFNTSLQKHVQLTKFIKPPV